MARDVATCTMSHERGTCAAKISPRVHPIWGNDVSGCWFDEPLRQPLVVARPAVGSQQGHVAHAPFPGAVRQLLPFHASSPDRRPDRRPPSTGFNAQQGHSAPSWGVSVSPAGWSRAWGSSSHPWVGMAEGIRNRRAILDKCYRYFMTMIQAHAVEAAAARHGVTAEGFFAVLDEVVASTAPLTQTEADLLAAGGVPPEFLTPDAQAAAQRSIGLAVAAADREATTTSLPTTDVVKRYGYQPSNLTRMANNGDIYAVKRPRGKGLLYPAWQFGPHGVLPGLRTVLPQFPADFHPLDIERFMTTPHDDLGNRSPRDWLLTGGDPKKVGDMVVQAGLA